MNYKNHFCLSVAKMNSPNKLLFYIFVITVYGVEKCVCSVLIKEKEVADAYIRFEETNSINNFNSENLEDDTPLILAEQFKRPKFDDDVESNEAGETKAEAVKRVTRQAHYDGTSLYPRLPTTPYQQQPYQNQNFNFNSQTNYTNPAYQQWHPSQPYNSQPGYPGNNPSYNSSHQTHPNNPYDHRPPYNQQGSNSNYNPNVNYQQHNTSNFDPGYPYRNTVAPGAPNVNSYKQPYGNSQPGYPGNNPSYNSSHQTHPNNPYDHRPLYNQQGSNSNYNPNVNYQQRNTTNFGPGYPYRNTVAPGAPNVNSYNPPGYSQSNNYSGSPPHSGYGRNSVSYNPNPTYYLSGNSSINKYPNSFYTSTLPPSFNRTGYGPSHGNFPSNWTLKGRPSNTSNSYYPVSSGQNPYQHNGPALYGVNHYVTPTSNLNRTQQSWPHYPTSNNNNNYSQNYPAHNPGYNSYNNSNNFNPNQGSYPKGNQYGTNYYPNNQFNGTSTYRLAETYTPSIPSHPPRNGPFPQNQFYSTLNMNASNQDPTKVAPERFSYH